MLEALQQEEYQEERAHVQQLEDVDEDFIVYPADDSGVWNETILNVFFFLSLGMYFKKPVGL